VGKEETPASQPKKTFSNILKVKSDPPGTTDEARSKAKKALAGAIAHGLRQFGEVQVRAFGEAAVSKAAFSIGIASGMVSVHGYDLYCRPCFITTLMSGKEITGISFLVVTSQMSEKS
jgi:stage V sporulation protein SpoVS